MNFNYLRTQEIILILLFRRHLNVYRILQYGTTLSDF